MGGGPVYDPSPFLGGNQGPVSGGVAKAGYAAAVLNTLDKGYKEKREREGAQLKSQFDFDNQQVEQAHANQQKYANHPQLAEKYTQDYAAALKERDKTNAKLKKYYGAKDTVWAALWDKARSAKTGSGQGAAATPGVQGKAPAGPPQPQTGVNQGAPGAAGVGKAFKVGDDYTAIQANFNKAAAIASGASQEQIAQIDKNTNDAILANQGEAQAQIQRQKALTATVAPIFKNLAAVPANQLSDKLPYAIDTLYESTSDAYPLDNPYFADPKDQAAKAAAQVWKEAAAKAPAEHTIAALERLKQRPEMKEQLPWIEGKLSQLHTELAALAGDYAKAPARGPAPKLPSGEQARVFERAGVSPNRDLSQYTPDEWQKVDSLEDKDHQAVLQKARETSAVHGGAHQYQQFQAMTKADTEDISTLKNRIGQIEAITANPQNSLSEDQKRDMQTELSNTRSQLTQAYENVKSAYGTIYGNGDASLKAKPAPVPSSSVEGLSPEGQKYLQGMTSQDGGK